MITIEQRVQTIVESSWGDKQTLIYRFTHELNLLRAALPSAADLESIAYHLEIGGGRDVTLPDGTFFDASIVLRRAAELIRLAINEEAEALADAKALKQETETTPDKTEGTASARASQ